MAYVSLYRRFRPDGFDKVIGQNHIVKTLINQINNDRINHSYLFTGSRGTGKTTCAKIFAKAVNCLTPKNGSPCNRCSVCMELSTPSNIDIIEIDAASNNGVDEIRQLKENIEYRPTVGKYKVYIIDEVHMLSTSAFNALLKTLEEPPEHIIFILATTEVQKLPATILSRCLRFDFRLIATKEIAKLIGRIFDELKVVYEQEAIQQIAVFGEGSVRDAISIADMCMSYCDNSITLKGVQDALGASDFQTIHSLGKAILLGDSGQALTVLDKLYNTGRNTIHKDLCSYFRDLVAIKNIKNYTIDSVSSEQAVLLKELAVDVENYKISRAMEIMVNVESMLRYSTQPRILLEATIVKACELRLDQSPEATLVRLKELEQKLGEIQKGGITITRQQDAPKMADTALSSANESEKANKIEVNTKHTVEDKGDFSDTHKDKIGTENVEDVLSHLTKNAVAVEEDTIFTDTISAEDEKAFAVWDRVVVRLKERQERTLYVVASQITTGISIDGNNLVLNTSDNAVINLFNEPRFLNVIKSCVKEELGREYNFICHRQLANTEQVQKSVGQLKDLFGEQLKIKN